MEEVQYIKLPAKTFRTISHPNKLHFGLNGSPAKRHFVKLNVADFVNEIKKRPVLYNMQHKDYKRICLRNRYWEEVAIAMSLSVQECKKRWRSMRDAFLKTVRNKNEVERQSWIHYRLLEFMLPYVVFRNEDCEVTSDYAQLRKDNEGESDFIEFDSDEELFDGPVTVSYVTQDGKQVFQVMHTPVREDTPVSTMHREEMEEEIEDCSEDQHLQPFAYGSSSGTEYLLTSTTDDESEQEAVLYEEQHSTVQLMHDEKPIEAVNNYPTGWNEEHVDDVKQIEPEPEPEISDTDVSRKRLRVESTQMPPSRPSSPSVSPSLSIISAPNPPPPEECKESDARLGITDPDERFLLSCAPILRRLPNKKNALARLKIQQMLFELEYDEKYSYEGT